MLREVSCDQPEPGVERRWFSDEDVDLILWSEQDEVVAFRVCFDKRRREHALSWNVAEGWRHDRVDSGEDDPRENRTPVLVPNGSFDPRALRSELRRRSVGLPAGFRELVDAKFDDLATVPSSR